MNLVGPFPASAVIERLRALPALRLVDGAAGLKSALEQPPRAQPAAYVLVEETGKPTGDYADTYAQPIDVMVKVVLWLQHASGGPQAVAEMERIERDVRSSLRTWSVPTPFEPLWVSHSGADQIIGSQLTRQVIFRTAYRDQELP